MKTLRLLVIVSIAVAMLFTAACSRNKTAPPEGTLIQNPSWYNQQDDPAYVFGYGVATWASMNSAINAAKAAAEAELARYVQVEVQSMLKLYEEESGVYDPQILRLSQNVVRSITQAEFRGMEKVKEEVRMVREHNSDRYRAWVKVRVPRTEVNRRTAEFIRNEEALYNQFKASQAFMELDEMLD